MVIEFKDLQNSAINQARGDYEAKDENMSKYQKIVCALLFKFNQVHLEQISWSHNTQPDALACLATLEEASTLNHINITKIIGTSTNEQAVEKTNPVGLT